MGKREEINIGEIMRGEIEERGLGERREKYGRERRYRYI